MTASTRPPRLAPLLAAHFREWKGPLRRITALAVVAALLDAAVLVALAPLIASIAVESDTISGTLLGRNLEIKFSTLLSITGVLVVVRAAIVLRIRSVEAGLLATYEETMRRRCIEAFVDATWSLQSVERAGRLQQYVGTNIGRSQTALRSVSVGISELCGLVILVLGAVAIGGPAVLGALLLLVILGLIVRPFQRISREASAEQAAIGPTWTTQIAETTGMVRETRVLQLRDGVVARLGETLGQMRRLRTREQVFTNGAPVIYESAGLIVVVVGLAVMRSTQPGNLTAIGASSLLLVRALLRARNLQSQYQSLTNLAPFVEGLNEVIAQYQGAAEEDGSRPLASIHTIAIKSASYAFDADSEVLHAIDLTIRSGEAVGVIGPSGAGKSTLLELLLRLRRATTGVVMVNDVDIAEYRSDDLYERIRFVPQDALLFDATVAQNVAGFSTRAESEIWNVLEKVGMADEVRERGGLDTSVGQFGNELSGGQRQRIAIARALISAPDVLILDEPTGALDPHSEAVVQRSLESLKGSVTVIVVAHRLSTLQLCDSVIVLEKGRITASGPRRELEAESQYFRTALELSMLR